MQLTTSTPDQVYQLGGDIALQQLLLLTFFRPGKFRLLIPLNPMSPLNPLTHLSDNPVSSDPQVSPDTPVSTVSPDPHVLTNLIFLSPFINCAWQKLKYEVIEIRSQILYSYNISRGTFHHDIPILIIDWSPKDISLEFKILISLQLLITQGYRHPGICLYVLR